MTAHKQGTSRPHLFRRRWLLLRWLGLRWERRLAWLVLVLFGAGPIVLSATLLWYVRSGRLARAFESQLAGVLGAPVKIEGLQVKGWRRYAIKQLTLLDGTGGSRPLLRAEEGVLTTGEMMVAAFQRATVDIGDDAALTGWRQFLLGPAKRGQLEPALELAVNDVRLARDVPGVRLPPGAKTSLRGAITIAPAYHWVSLYGGSRPGEPPSLVAESGSSYIRLTLSPPGLLGVERLATNLGWPSAVIPANLEGGVGLGESSGVRNVALMGAGTLDLAEVARALGLPDCSGTVTLTTDLDLRSGVDAGRSRGTVSVALAGPGPAQVDPLALEVFRYIFFGQLSDRPLEEDVYTLERMAFTVTLAGDRITVAGENGPLLSGRSQRGYAIELTSPAQATTEELARRVRLALGGLPAGRGSEAGEGPGAPPASSSP